MWMVRNIQFILMIYVMNVEIVLCFVFIIIVHIKKSLLYLVQKKILKNKTLPQIAEESEEDTIVIEPIYTLIKENPEAEKEEIYKMLNL